MEPDTRPASPVVLVVDALATDVNGRIPLVRNVGNWWLPGGRVDRGESFLGAAVRETAEETGLELRPDGIVRIAQQTKDDRHVIFITVRGSVTGDLAMPQDDSKISDVRWVPTSGLKDLVPTMAQLWKGLLKASVIDEELL